MKVNKNELNEIDLYTWEDMKRAFWLGGTAGLVAAVPLILLIWWLI